MQMLDFLDYLSFSEKNKDVLSKPDQIEISKPDQIENFPNIGFSKKSYHF